MAPPLQAIILAASFILLILSCSAQLAERPSPSTTLVASAPLKLSSSGFLYSMEYRIGNTEMSGIMDTGSDLIWTNTCKVFDSLVSCPFPEGEEMGMSCCNNLIPTFEREYGKTSRVGGIMGNAKLTLKLDQDSYTTPNTLNIGKAFVSDCHLPSVNGEGSQACKAYKRGGIVGLGRGKLSLVKQLEVRSFSYCLPGKSSGANGIGQIKFFKGEATRLTDAKTTNLAPINGKLSYPDSSRYYLQLTKIVIRQGATKQEVIRNYDCPNPDPKLGASSHNPGMIIDSGTSFTTLPEEAFNAVKKQVELVMKKSETAKDPVKEEHINGLTCYTGKYPDGVGSIELHFCDDQVSMEIPAENYLNEEDGKICIAIKEAGSSNGTPILGIYQQQGMHMLFDIQRNTLSFAKSSGCGGQSKEENHATL